MIDEAKRKNKKLFVVKQNRYNPPVIKMTSAICFALSNALNISSFLSDIETILNTSTPIIFNSLAIHAEFVSTV